MGITSQQNHLLSRAFVKHTYEAAGNYSKNTFGIDLINEAM
jgi:hypothetical protein